MQRPPRAPGEGIFNRKMVTQSVLSGATMGFIAVAFWWALMDAGMEESSARNRLLLLFVLMQNVHVFNCRSEYASAFAVPLARNRVLAVGVPAALGVHLLAMNLPFMQSLLRVSPLAPSEWLAPVAFALSVLVVMELYKVVARRRRTA
jgi:P-type Ca2+ transporter type 2C